MRTSTKFVLVFIIISGLAILVHQFYFYNKEKIEDPCWPFCAGMSEEERNALRADLIKASCPDELIINKMPNISSQKPESYYIKDGKRVEVSEYDSIWVNANCEVPITEVF